MATRNRHIAALVKKKGGDAIQLSLEVNELQGFYSYGNSFTSSQATAFGSLGFAHGFSKISGWQVLHSHWQESEISWNFWFKVLIVRFSFGFTPSGFFRVESVACSGRGCKPSLPD